MKNNASLHEIGKILEKADSVLIFPHVSPDGDAMGSATGLYKALTSIGKKCAILLEEDIPEYISFLPFEGYTKDQNIIEEPDVTICVDCSEPNRIPSRVEAFEKGKTRVCIDHHINPEGYGDYYYIDEGTAAASELIYTLIDEMTWPMDEDTAVLLYAGIVTDTGGFRYSNTTASTHRIAANLIEAGVNVNDISVALYQNVSREQTLAEAMILEKMDIFADGKGAISYVTLEELDEIGASPDDTENVIDRLRDVKGVEIAAFLKPKGNKVKASLRAKTYGDVQKIATTFGGGGHKKAAGCTIDGSVEKAAESMKNLIADSLEK
ncbi:MAG: bifunctional oligoribonuclease/PAP phosphatase NrnA [Bacillota bacterium]|nr:bifunctional oligoribonuclease/PAP phosphatase NrnA [Bacillota bacterium]